MCNLGWIFDTLMDYEFCIETLLVNQRDISLKSQVTMAMLAEVIFNLTEFVKSILEWRLYLMTEINRVFVFSYDFS